MVDQLSPLQPVWRPGSHGNFADGVGVVLSELQPGSIVEAAAWPGREAALRAAVAKATGLAVADGANAGTASEEKAVFAFAPGRLLVADAEEDLAARLKAAVGRDVGTLVDLSHGRTALRIDGPRAEWVLAKFFAIDFSEKAFPVGSGRATSHHDFFVQVQRSGDRRFDLYVYRSFARAFWQALCHASAEVGYEVR